MALRCNWHTKFADGKFRRGRTVDHTGSKFGLSIERIKISIPTKFRNASICHCGGIDVQNSGVENTAGGERLIIQVPNLDEP